MINMGVELFLLASGNIGVLGLRLVCKNCPLYAMPYPPAPALLKRVSETLLADASGWLCCGAGDGTGFAGRAAVMEKLRSRKLQSVAQEQGMQTLWEGGVARAAAGEIPPEELAKVAKHLQKTDT